MNDSAGKSKNEKGLLFEDFYQGFMEILIIKMDRNA